MTMQTVSLNKSYGGTQGVYRHASSQTRTDMTFAVYVPPHAAGARLRTYCTVAHPRSFDTITASPTGTPTGQRHPTSCSGSAVGCSAA